MAGRGRSPRTAFLELFALNGLVVVQPLLDAMGRSPELFVLRRASRLDIALLVGALVVVPPLALWSLGRVVRAPAVHRVIVALLLVLLALLILKDATSWQGLPLAAAALGAGAAAAAAWHHVAVVQTWLRYLAPAPLVFALLFLLLSPVSRLVVGAGAAAAQGRPATDDRPPVLMFVLDELPLMSLLDDDGRIHEGLFPSFARLAAGSTWFRNATAVNGYSSQAVPALVTGRLPEGRAPVAVDHPSSLFTLLGGGYRVVAYEAVTALCPVPVCEQGAPVGATGFGALVSDATRAYADVVSLRAAGGSATDTIFDASDAEREARRDAAAESAHTGLKINQPTRFTAFLEELRGDRPGTFWFLHLLMPHTPWRFLPSGMQYEHRSFGRDGDVWADEPWVTTHHQQRHLLQLVYTDRLLGRILDRLEDEGLYDDALLVVTSDHGAGFTAGAPFRKLEEENVAQLAWVPLFVKTPGQQRGEVRDDNVMSVDVLPTVADVLGVDLPWEIDGVSAFGPPRTTAEKLFKSAGDKVIDGERWLPEVLRGSAARFDVAIEEPDDLFRVGPRPDLLGMQVRPAPDGDAGWAVVDERSRFDAVQPASGTVPALVTGVLQSDVEMVAVAVALNGRVVATSDAYGTGERRFAALLPGDAFVDGRNRLDVVGVTADGALVPLPVRG